MRRTKATKPIIGKDRMMKRKGTGMEKSGPITLISVVCALLMLVPGVALAQSGGNPWNPYRAAQQQMAPRYITSPPLVQPPHISPQFPNLAPNRAPSRFAPPGLEQQLATGAQPQPPVATYFTPPPAGYAPQGYDQRPNVPGPGYGAYPQQAYGNNGYSGYGANGPLPPYGRPGGSGGFVPFPGNPTNGSTNGGFPGFNMPFGFF